MLAVNETIVAKWLVHKLIWLCENSTHKLSFHTDKNANKVSGDMHAGGIMRQHKFCLDKQKYNNTNPFPSMLLQLK